MRAETLNTLTDEYDNAECDGSACGFDLIARQMRSRLQMAGLKATPQRLALCSLLFIAGDRHMTAEILDREAKAMDLPLTPKAIKATLREFVGVQLLREIALYGETIWYDTNTGPHFHFYDEDAKLLFDMPETMIPHLNLPELADIEFIGVDLIVRIRRKHDGERQA
jgi:Fur family iron response transcriptional regulator